MLTSSIRRLAGREDKEQRTVWSQRDSCVQDRTVQGAQELHGVDVGSNKVGPKSCKIMNEIYFGTATTQNRIPSEICGVSGSSYIYGIDQASPHRSRIKATALTP